MKEKKEEAEYASRRGEGSKTALGNVPANRQRDVFPQKNHARITCRGKMPLWPLMKQEYGGKQTV